MLLWTSSSMGGGGEKRIGIWNRNLQTKIIVFLCAYTLLHVHRSVVSKIFLFLLFPSSGCCEVTF